MDQTILEREVLRLPADQRARLADALLGSLDDETRRESEGACATEAEDRYEAFLAGKLEALDGPSVLRELRRRYGK